jgi:hypothetical protein
MDIVIQINDDTNDTIILLNKLINNYDKVHVIIPDIYIENIKNILLNNKIFFYNFETFFVKNYNLDIHKIKAKYFTIHNHYDKFDYWYSKLINVGIVFQIKDLSNPFILYNHYQELYYPQIINDLLHFYPNEIQNINKEYYILYHNMVKNMLLYIIVNKKEKNWIERILNLSNKYQNFNEFELMNCFIQEFYK